ncbi:MAG TPA: hypothetical protein VK013_00220 [Myxococcaceae bacterium]|nr:hypothetical protein [Myxococcaceae bacterium]
MTRTVRLVIWALLFVTFGFVVAYMGRPVGRAVISEDAEAPVESPSEPPASSGFDESPGVTERLGRQESENRKLEQRLKDLELKLAAARSPAGDDAPHVMLPPATAEASDGAAISEAPLPFPTELSEAYTPAGFEDVTLRATRECGMPLSVVAIDCSEFPCIAWTRVTGPGEEGKPFSMDSCGPWAEVFKNGTMVVGSVTQADVEPREVYFAWMALPEQEDLVRPAMARARQRTQEMKAALQLQ